MERIPVACTLTSTELARRAGEWADVLERFRGAPAATATGVVVRFDAAARSEVARLAEQERACCAWADWQVSDAGDASVLRADSTDEFGVRTLQQLFGL